MDWERIQMYNWINNICIFSGFNFMVSIRFFWFLIVSFSFHTYFANMFHQFINFFDTFIDFMDETFFLFSFNPSISKYLNFGQSIKKKRVTTTTTTTNTVRTCRTIGSCSGGSLSSQPMANQTWNAVSCSEKNELFWKLKQKN